MTRPFIKHTCVVCGRVGSTGYTIVSGDPTQDFATTQWKCTAQAACDLRRKTRKS